MNPEFGHHPQEEHSGEIPEVLKQITPYEKVRPLDAAYENLKSLDDLSEAELQERAELYQTMPEFKEYRNLYLNFHDMDRLTEEFEPIAEEAGKPELANELKAAVSEIKLCVSTYYKAVMAFDRASINKFRMDAQEFQDNMVRADRHRTLMHNRLIDAVVSYTRLLNVKIPKETGHRFEKKVMFDPNMVQDLRSTNKSLHNPARDKIANWAFLNERGIHVERALERVQDLLENKKAASE